ncbi:MAG: hypothetical protein AAB533_00240 [Patescibacteria group bacterium]
MMGYGGGWGMSAGAGFIGSIAGLVVLANLILVGIWLYQQVTKK